MGIAVKRGKGSPDRAKPDQAKNEWENADFLMVRQRLLKVARQMEMDDDTLEPLLNPKRALSVVMPVRMDDGTVETFLGYRVHHDLALGPGKGGIRFHPNVNLGEVAAMAMLMSWKCSLMNLPFGGAHGGIRVDPAKLSSGELERVTRRYVSEIIELIGPDQDIAGPDLNTNEQTMAWMMDTYSVNVGHTVPSIVTGKPKCIGGSLGLSEATGYGVALCARQAAEHYHLTSNSPSVIIQGLGTVGSVVARILSENDFTVLGVSDTRGGLYNPKGLNMNAVTTHISRKGSMVGYPEAQSITNEELLEMPCDILAPCAVANQIHKGNAGRLKCKILVEGANAPTTPEADDILNSKGLPVMPDILANASSVTVGYFEWVQGLIRLLWSEEEVFSRLDRSIIEICDRVFALAEKQKVSLRDAAMRMAIERIVEARRLRGLYP
jgi:glutamate dehydrogenase (NAD(P)+)